MFGSWNPAEFPNLVFGTFDPANMSDPTTQYNCIAWAAMDKSKKWWPDPLNIGKWPPGVERAETISAFIAAYGVLGYVVCEDGDLEPAYEKIALYATPSQTPTHAARQLPNGHWTSKLGDFEDIEHFTLEAVQSPAYGQVVKYMKRRRSK